MQALVVGSPYGEVRGHVGIQRAAGYAKLVVAVQSALVLLALTAHTLHVDLLLLADDDHGGAALGYGQRTVVGGVNEHVLLVAAPREPVGTRCGSVAVSHGDGAVVTHSRRRNKGRNLVVVVVALGLVNYQLVGVLVGGVDVGLVNGNPRAVVLVVVSGRVVRAVVGQLDGRLVGCQLAVLLGEAEFVRCTF